MKIRFVFHNPKGERGIGIAIVAYTWLLGLFYNRKVLPYNFSHMEIWFADNAGNFENGHCFSSTTRGNSDGVRYAPASEILFKHPERWSYIECEVDPLRILVAKEEAQRLVGKKYDYLGIFGFVTPFPIHHKDKWFCSEICMCFAYLIRATNKRYKRISPRRAAYKLARLYGEPKALKGE